jgi:methylenetetrahydrofolate dehydrogenase (NADP+)/methenyltetrahydrofolate cyclohydrolase
MALNNKRGRLLDGKLVAKALKESIKKEIAEMVDRGEDGPHLAAVIVGNDPASETYVASKEKAARGVGMVSSVYRYPEDTTEKELMDVIDFLNRDPEITGFIVQLPLPKHINEEKIIERIKPSKDVDGFNPVNVGKMAIGQPGFVSATPAGIMEILRYYNIDTEGKNCVVLGRSNIVGSPMSILMSKKSNPGNATVTLCHSKTQNLEEITRKADILIAAIGSPQFVKADMVKEGAVVIDVGIHRIEDKSAKKGYKLVGDVDFEAVKNKASYITPVPGGVGPMTIASLLNNTLKAYKSEYYG